MTTDPHSLLENLDSVQLKEFADNAVARIAAREIADQDALRDELKKIVTDRGWKSKDFVKERRKPRTKKTTPVNGDGNE
jgi:hypothetical protein